MSMKEKLRQVRGAICVNRREIAHTRLEAIAGADNPYSLITIFKRGHLAIKAGGAVRDKVLASGGAATLAQELHREDSRNGQRDGCLHGPDQLRHQERGVTHPLQ